MIQRIYPLFLVLIILLLSACGQLSQVAIKKSDHIADQQAISAEKSGNYLTAAQLYLKRAKSTKKGQQAQYYLQAANAFKQANRFDDTVAALARVNKTLLSEALQLDAAILGADIAIFQQDPEQALAILDTFDLQKAPEAQYKAALKTKIQAYKLTENWLEKANAHIALAELLSDEQAISDNQQFLWQALTSLTPLALDLFNPGIPPSIDSGWFALAYIVTTYQSNSDALVVALEDWQRSYPNHPADAIFYETSIATSTRNTPQLDTIAILLPDSGPYASAANAIKQGIIAAHYSSQSSTNLHFFAIETDNETGRSNVWQQYQNAIDQNASLVIGPLDKASVRILVAADSLPIPVLALNRLSNDEQKDNLFQFGLAPEDDAIAAANYASQKGYQRAIVLAPNNAWGTRISSAFNEQWLQQGGTLLNSTQYDESGSDFSANITQLLSLETSKQRHRKLIQLLGTSIEFEPRRRQDIDFLFLVARPLKARQLLPQLKFHRAGHLPVIATSHAYSGQENRQQNIDLNGLIINDIPWVFNTLASTDPAYITLQDPLPQHFNQMIRLYALGADAYRLSPELKALPSSSPLLFSGATGKLSINEAGQINRETPWAVFKRGRIKLLAPIADAMIIQ